MRFSCICKLVFGCLLIHSSIVAQTPNEILGRPTDSSMTISVLFNQPTEVYWEYGTSPGSHAHTTPAHQALKDTPLEIDFSGLNPDTRYYYRTRSRMAGSTGPFSLGVEHRFMTQRSPAATYSFTIEADEHLYDIKGVRSLYKICLENQAKDEPDFMLSLGDIFGDDHYPTTITSAKMDELHKDYRQYLGNICHSIPFFVCLGNHEGEKDYYLTQNPPDNMAVYATLWRKFYYPNPYPNNFYTGNNDLEPYDMGHPENYYAWKWGDALFVVLDVYRDQCDTSAKPKNWDWSLGLPQYTWLKNTLENSHEKYKFVFAHHTRGEGRGGAATAKYVEWGGYEPNGVTWGFATHRPGWAKPIHQLFVDNGVNIFFQGHDHLFAHEVLDGVTYQEVPMPSDSTYELGVLANADAYLTDIFAGSGHLKVTVSPQCIKVDFIRAWLPADTLSGAHHNREVAFSYTIGNCSSGVNNLSEGHDVTVYPNPASKELTISTPDHTGHFQAVLINTLGRKLLQTQSNVIDVSSFPAGIYMLEIRSATYEMYKKVIISR
ncbi:MAG: T9SS type A sorting domain-containing protein [Bacteroidales bacterium]